MDEQTAYAKPLEVVQFGRYTFDLWRKDVSCNGRTVRLRMREALIFRVIAEAGGKFVHVSKIVDVLYDHNPNENTECGDLYVRSVISRLRKQLRSITPGQQNDIINSNEKSYALLQVKSAT